MKEFIFKGRFIFIPLAIAGFICLAGLAVMALWNNLLPDILHVATITFGQAVGLFVLCKLLFGFGRGGGRGFGGGPGWMRHKMQERLKNMTPEEREAFKQKMREQCGPFGRGRRHFGNWDDVAEEHVKPTE